MTSSQKSRHFTPKVTNNTLNLYCYVFIVDLFTNPLELYYWTNRRRHTRYEWKYLTCLNLTPTYKSSEIIRPECDDIF